MSRWEPDARGRLQQAALELYIEHGFDQTTVAEIAARAGLTERTFFRHFADKREVLFWGSLALQDLLARAVASVPASMAPIDAVAAALEATTPLFEERFDFARQRHALIVANPELQERELIKLASLATIIAEALRRRGVPDPAASLASEAGIAVFRLAFESWVHDAKRRALSHHVRQSLGSLKAVTSGKAIRKMTASTSPAKSPSSPKQGSLIDDYLAAVGPANRALLEELRRTIHAVVPEAEECISYRMPAFRLDGRIIAGFSGTSKGCSYYPFSGTTLKTLADDVEGYDHTQSALHFGPDRPLPKSLVRKLLKARMAEGRERKPSRARSSSG